jgi:hypothetical protein
VRPNSTIKTSLRVEDCTTFINTQLVISLTNVGLLTRPLTPRIGHLERGINNNGCPNYGRSPQTNGIRINSYIILEIRRSNSTTTRVNIECGWQTLSLIFKIIITSVHLLDDYISARNWRSILINLIIFCFIRG